MTRKEAMSLLKKPSYDVENIKSDFNYIANKLDILVEDLENILV